MEQDIRKLFETDDGTNEKLPMSHRGEFQQKLRASKLSNTRKKGVPNVFKYAAAILMLFAIGYFSFDRMVDKPIIQESALEVQLKEIEQQYLENIEKEWQSFKAMTDDEKLIERYEKELEELNTDYQEITEQFKENKNNILIIENLVDNLQTRLQLLKDIQNHIKLLNQKNAHYETIQI